MSEMKVKDLAKTINIPVEKLLGQFREAGVSVVDADHVITDAEKTQLLQFLHSPSSQRVSRSGEGEQASGDAAEAPKRITLKRKRVSELSSRSADSRSKKVKVEVRKKRTYVKRTEPEVDETETEAAPEAITEAVVGEQVNVEQANVEQSVPEASEPVETEAIVADEAAELTPPAGEAAGVAEDAASVRTEATAPKKPAAVSPKAEAGKERANDKKQAVRKQQSQHSKKLTRAKISVTSNFEEDGYGAAGRRRRRKSKRSQADSELLSQHGFEKPTEPVVREVEVGESILVSELAKRMHVKAAALIKVLFQLGVMVTINQTIDQDTAILAVEEMGHVAKTVNADAIEDVLEFDETAYSKPVTRPPVVTVMGHVDHGKTSLLDYIRRTKVTVGEAGGITQHIGAYHVKTDRGGLSFVDTPGHEAFTAMRARGAQVTDIVILVVAADDGVMPQTIEAIQHAKAAGVPIIVAVNKMDKPEADPDRVKTELSQHEVLPEDWGGDTMFVPISAKTGDGIDTLLDAVLIQAEMLELKASVDGPARGTVVEARIDRGRGAVTTILVQGGTLRKGDIVVAGIAVCRVRALMDDTGTAVTSAGPSMPVEVLGFSTLPAAGDDAIVIQDEKQARDIVEHRLNKKRQDKFLKQRTDQRNLLFRDVGVDVAYLPLMIKADVQGSLEALSDSLNKMSTDDVKVKIVAVGIGAITESDVYLAQASKAMIVGFNVRADSKARQLVEREGVNLRYYSVIYDVMKDVEAVMTSLLAPEKRENILGLAEVRDVFRSPKFGAVAGCMVVDGTVKRNFPIRVLRDNVVIYEGELESLRRFKDDVNEVRNGMECGIAVKNYNDVKAGDQIEVYEVVEVTRELNPTSASKQGVHS